jgi:hypothetical protein
MKKEKESKFKVGDKVRVIEEGDDYGVISTVTYIYESGNDEAIPYPICLNSNDVFQHECFNEEHLEYYKIKDTKLARKMYPNFTVLEEGWICPNGENND